MGTSNGDTGDATYVVTRSRPYRRRRAAGSESPPYLRPSGRDAVASLPKAVQLGQHAVLPLPFA